MRGGYALNFLPVVGLTDRRCPFGRPFVVGKTPPKHAAEPRHCPCPPRPSRRLGLTVKVWGRLCLGRRATLYLTPKGRQKLSCRPALQSGGVCMLCSTGMFALYIRQTKVLCTIPAFRPHPTLLVSRAMTVNTDLSVIHAAQPVCNHVHPRYLVPGTPHNTQDSTRLGMRSRADVMSVHVGTAAAPVVAANKVNSFSNASFLRL